MSCYFRHMEDILTEAGVVVTASNKKQIDKVFHDVVGVTYKDCPTTWRILKQGVISDDQKRRELIDKLQAAVH
ncbi:MAG: hypothetical protein OEV52_06280 [Dehalococcoidia bacterium]|nr:hypothetical protein [Dehalococcoidia bacterium]